MNVFGLIESLHNYNIKSKEKLGTPFEVADIWQWTQQVLSHERVIKIDFYFFTRSVKISLVLQRFQRPFYF